VLEVKDLSLAHKAVRPIRSASCRVLDGLAAGLADPGWPRRAPAIRLRRRPLLDVDAFTAEEAPGA
jgi:hypothetical protein